MGKLSELAKEMRSDLEMKPQGAIETVKKYIESQKNVNNYRRRKI